MYEETGLDQGSTIFNSGIATLSRIHNDLLKAKHFSEKARGNGSYYPEYLLEWRNALDSLYRELECKLNDKEIELIEKNYKLFKKYSPLVIVKKDGKGDVVRKIDVHKFNHYYKLCDFIEKKLRKMADNKGMLLPNGQYAGNVLGT